MQQEQEKVETKSAFQFLDFTKDADKYLKEIEKLNTSVVSTASSTSFTSSTIRTVVTDILKSSKKKDKKKLTLFELNLIDALRQLRAEFFPTLRGFPGHQVRSAVGMKANFMEIEEITNNKLRFHIQEFRKLEREKQEDLIIEAFA